MAGAMGGWVGGPLDAGKGQGLALESVVGLGRYRRSCDPVCYN